MNLAGIAIPVAIAMVLAIILASLVRKRRSFSIPQGDEVYQDIQGKGKVLVSRSLGISGKPDMVMHKGQHIIPYEYKSTDAERPRDGHLYQMFAYFAILEENYPDASIAYGVLKYKNAAFKVHNTRENRLRLLAIIDEMRQIDSEPARNHDNRGKCFRCSFKEICRQSLIKQER